MGQAEEVKHLYKVETLKVWDAQGGRITLGGEEIQTIDPETLLTHYAIVFQDVVLFNNSVLENIPLGT